MPNLPQDFSLAVTRTLHKVYGFQLALRQKDVMLPGRNRR